MVLIVPLPATDGAKVTAEPSRGPKPKFILALDELGGADMRNESILSFRNTAGAPILMRDLFESGVLFVGGGFAEASFLITRARGVSFQGSGTLSAPWALLGGFSSGFSSGFKIDAEG